MSMHGVAGVLLGCEMVTLWVMLGDGVVFVSGQR